MLSALEDYALADSVLERECCSYFVGFSCLPISNFQQQKTLSY